MVKVWMRKRLVHYYKDGRAHIASTMYTRRSPVVEGWLDRVSHYIEHISESLERKTVTFAEPVRR